MTSRELIRRLALASVVLAAGTTAWGDSVIHDPRGDVERWHRDAVPLVYSTGPQPAGFENLPAAIEGAAAAWNALSPTPRIEPRAGDPGSIGFDSTPGATNTSGVYVSTTGIPGFTGDALAVTFVTTDAATGEILDTDVVVNARDHQFALLGPDGLLGSASVPYDIQNTLTHEFGHVLGLGEDPGHPLATMYPTSMPGEVQKRSLDTEDVTSVDAAYAQSLATSTSTTTAPTNGTGCGGAHIAPRTHFDDSALFLVALVLIATTFAARRRRVRLGALLFAASCLIGASPSRPTLRAGEARVVSRDATWQGHVLHTRAVAVDADGREHVVDALGGRSGSYVMHVYGAADGAALEPGATISLSPSP